MNKIAFIVLPSIVLLSGLFVSLNAQTSGAVSSGLKRSGSSGSGQTVSTALISVPPVPAWPPDGNIPETLKNQYVFYEQSTDSYILCYPENLTNPEGSEKRRPPIRLARKNGVKPVVSVQVTEKDGLYNYVYQIQNEPSAKLAINSISLVVDSLQESKVEVTRIPSWSSGNKFSSTVAKQIAALGSPGGAFVLWYATPEGEIVPGKTASEFRIVSDAKPGLTTVYFSGGPARSFDTEVPSEVIDQLNPLFTYEKDSYVVLTLGPVYSTKATKVSIATNLDSVIRMLVNPRLSDIIFSPGFKIPEGTKFVWANTQGRLDGYSPFVQEVLTKLKEYYVPNLDNISNTAFSAPFPEILAKPTTPLEKEIATALALAMKDK
ncbi:MAG: hypothetical protein ACRD4L_01810 [Pyrinomonadaceae bacterium]